MRRCSSCNEYKYDRSHQCAPRWLVWTPEDAQRDDASPVYAHDAELAAEKYVETSDPDMDYTCVSGNPISVHVVADHPDGPDGVLAFVVTGEAVPSYRAEPVEPRDGCTAYRVSRLTHFNAKSAGGERICLELQDLEGEIAGDFIILDLKDRWPERDEYVQIDGPVEGPCTISWGPNGMYSITKEAP